MLEELRKSYHILPSQNESVRKWKREGKKVFGYVCTTVPEEIIYAAGILPLRILGTSEEIVKADRHCPTFVCYPVRSMLDLGLRGEFNILDGMVTTYACEGGNIGMQLIAETVKLPYYWQLIMPHNRRSEAYTYFLSELTEFKKSLEGFIGSEITDDSLRQAIEVCNEKRLLLQKAYDLRGKDKQPKLSGSEVAEIVMSSMLMPEEEHNKLVSGVIENIPERKELPKVGPRIHISGTMLPPDFTLFNLIEELGGMVVSDDLCVGSRYFQGQVDTCIKPLEALVKYYLDVKPHCSFVYADDTWKNREDYLNKMVRDYQADGVIFCDEMWCDPYIYPIPHFIRHLNEAGIPTLSIEVERAFDLGAVRTRLQAFLELIEGGKR